MAKFFVGQRVRVVSWWADEMHDGGQLIGHEAVVNDPWCESWEGTFGVGITCLGDDGWCAPPEALEPILPSGHQPAELTVEELLPFLKTREAA